MKVKLAPQLRLNLYFCAVLSIGYYLYLIYLFSGPGIYMVRELPVIVVWMVLVGLWPVCFWFPNRKKLATVWIDESVIKSCRFGKMKCEVFTERDMYYSVFESNSFQGVRQWGRYIILSNEPFMYSECAGAMEHLDMVLQSAVCYDETRQIILPYDKRTIPLLPVEKWTKL